MNKIIFIVLFLICGCFHPIENNVVHKNPKHKTISDENVWFKDLGNQTVEKIQWEKITKKSLEIHKFDRCNVIMLCVSDDCKIFSDYLTQKNLNYKNYYFLKHVIDQDRQLFYSIMHAYFAWSPHYMWQLDELPQGYPHIDLKNENVVVRLTLLLVIQRDGSYSFISYDHNKNNNEIYEVINWIPYNETIINDHKQISINCKE